MLLQFSAMALYEECYLRTLNVTSVILENFSGTAVFVRMFKFTKALGEVQRT